MLLYSLLMVRRPVVCVQQTVLCYSAVHKLKFDYDWIKPTLTEIDRNSANVLNLDVSVDRVALCL